MISWRIRLAIACGLLVIFLRAAAARAEISPADRGLLNKVTERLLAVVEPAPDFQWPPIFTIKDQDLINAFASARFQRDGDGRVQIVP